MLIHDQHYLDTLHEILSGAETSSVAVAFWGAGSDSLFKQWRGTSLRIICNLALGGTNPEVIPKLQALQGAEVLQLDNLHAKLVLTDRAMVLGSANMSTNGLGLEASEVAGFMELGVLSRDAELLGRAGTWFDRLWTLASPIKKEDLERAKEAWAKRRTKRPLIRRHSKTSKSLSLLEQSADDLKDRMIYFVVYRYGLGSMAKDRLMEENKKLAGSAQLEHDRLDVYEGWEADDLPKDPSAVIIPIYWGARGRIEVFPAQRPVPELQDSYIEAGEDGEDSEEWRLDFTAFVRDPSLLGLPFSFTTADRRKLEKPIGDWLQSCRDRFAEEHGLCLPVYDFLSWRQSRSR